jgi:hypothetical protein
VNKIEGFLKRYDYQKDLKPQVKFLLEKGLQ